MVILPVAPNTAVIVLDACGHEHELHRGGGHRLGHLAVVQRVCVADAVGKGRSPEPRGRPMLRRAAKGKASNN